MKLKYLSSCESWHRDRAAIEVLPHELRYFKSMITDHVVGNLLTLWYGTYTDVHKKRLRLNMWYFHKFWDYNDVFIHYDIFTYEPVFLSWNFIKTSLLLINARAHARFARVKVLTLTWDKILIFLCIWFHLLISKSIFNEFLTICHFKA